MFGFLKKREAPEEEQPQKAAGAAEKEAEELRTLGRRFLPEERTILAVTGANGFGGDRVREGGPWLARLELTAWKDADGEEPARRESVPLLALADDKLLAYLRRRAPRDSVIQVKVRPAEDFSAFLLVELPQPMLDPEMKAILDEQKKPVSVWVPDLGTFVLNRTVNWFEAEVKWRGAAARLDIDREEDWDACVENARRLMAAQEDWDGRVRAFAAEKLLDAANDWARQDESQEEPEEITAQQFAQRLELDAVQVSAGGGLEFWFNDGDLFWGHAVHVTASLDGGPEDARMEG